MIQNVQMICNSAVEAEWKLFCYSELTILSFYRDDSKNSINKAEESLLIKGLFWKFKYAAYVLE